MPKALDETFYVTDDGKLADQRRAEWLRSQLQLYAGGQVRIRIGRPKRSTRANAYYWGVVIATVREALMEAGMPVSAEALHVHFKRRYLEPRTTCVLGIDHVLDPTTTDMDSTEFSYYIEAIKEDEDVRRLGVYIPEPDENMRSSRIAEPA